MPGTKHKHRSQVAVFKETAVGTPPVSWGVSGLPIDHLQPGPEIGAIKSSFTDDMTAEAFGQGVGSRLVLENDRNNEFKFSTYWYGLGTVPADGAPAVANVMTDLMEYALGDATYSRTTTITGGTALEPILDDVTGYEVGQLIQVKDISAAGTATHWAYITDVDVGTLTLTLSKELPFTPAAGDIVYGVATISVDEDVIESAVGANKTLSFYLRRAFDADYIWQVTGGVVSLSIAAIERGQAPKLEWTVMGSDYKHSDEDGLSSVTFATPTFGFAPLATPTLRCSIAEVGDAACNFVSVSSFAVDLGIKRDRVPAVTSEVGLYGMGDYTVKFENSELTVVLTKYDPVWYAGLKAETKYEVTLYQGTKGAGKAWCVHLPSCQLVENPSLTEVGEALGVQLKFRAEPNRSGATDLEVSRVVLGVG